MFRVEDMVNMFPENEWLKSFVDAEDDSSNSPQLSSRKRPLSEVKQENTEPVTTKPKKSNEENVSEMVQSAITEEFQKYASGLKQSEWEAEFSQTERDAYVNEHRVEWEQQVKNEMRQCILEQIKQFS